METLPIVENLNLPLCEIFLVSDLHIARGEGTDGLYSGTENFFYDAAFSRFLDYCQLQCADKKGVLIINGDFIDFLRIIFLDGEWEFLDFNRWSLELEKVSIYMSPDDLRNSIDASTEKDYGFKTNDFKSIWKLQKAEEGHMQLFDAIAKWLSNPINEIIILKGNHDLEWYWPKVQEYFRYLIQKRLGITIKHTVAISYYQDAIIINKKLYIEHGHRYDTFTYVVGPDELRGKNAGQLNLPLGSFVNRYIANSIETIYPYMDNIRPSQNVVPLLIKQDFGLALKIIFKRIPKMLKFLKKKQIKYVFGRFLDFFLVIAVPLIIAIVIFCIEYERLPAFKATLGSVTQYLSLLKSVVPLIGSYFLGRIVAHFRLSEPDNLYEFSKAIFKRFGEVEIITMGHTHVPYQKYNGNKKYINSGTWIPEVEYSSSALRDDNTYNFIHFTITNNTINCSPLFRWNDSANRPDEMAIIDNLPLNWSN